jgi:hypothetical protein
MAKAAHVGMQNAIGVRVPIGNWRSQGLLWEVIRIWAAGGGACIALILFLLFSCFLHVCSCRINQELDNDEENAYKGKRPSSEDWDSSRV